MKKLTRKRVAATLATAMIVSPLAAQNFTYTGRSTENYRILEKNK